MSFDHSPSFKNMCLTLVGTHIYIIEIIKGNIRRISSYTWLFEKIPADLLSYNKIHS